MATLAGLARATSSMRLGVLVSPVTFRLPGSLAKVIQTVDEMSGGRVDATWLRSWSAASVAIAGRYRLWP